MKKLLLIAVLLLGTFTAANAQNFAVGLRGGGMSSGITFKKFFSNSNAIEGTIGLHYKNMGAIVNGLYEFNVPLVGDNFYFYYGFGGHIGGYNTIENETKVSKLLLGADVVVGIEYIIPGAPIAFSLDYHPAINILSNLNFWLADVGLGVKFCF